MPLELRGTNYESTLSPDCKVIVGDENSADFRPHVRYARWGDESWLSLRFTDLVRTNPTFDGTNISWSDGTLDLRFYDLAAKEQMQRGGFEFDIRLAAPPIISSIVFQVESTGLDLFFQPKLTRFEETRGNIRPANVVGSYAAYSRIKGNAHSIPGDAQKYGTGKAFHIYRPQAVDSLGNTLWLDLIRDELSGTFAIPLTDLWFQTANYPVTIDPTVGYTPQGGTQDNTGDFILAGLFTAPEAGDANPGTFFCYQRINVAGSCVVMGGAYASISTGASKLSTSDATITVNSTTMQQWSAAITWTGITATSYGIIINGQDNGTSRTQTAYDGTGGTANYAARNHANDLPATLPTMTTGLTWRLSQYVDYTASGGGVSNALMMVGTGT